MGYSMSYRRLAAVMVTDMVGFNTLMEADEDGAIEALHRGHRILRDIVSRHGGEWLEDVGDRSLSAFPCACNAVECALEIQAELQDEPEIGVRISVDIGDIIKSGNHFYGNTVNVASSIERLADPEGLVITKPVYDAVQGHIDLNVIDLGNKLLKNIGHSIRLYALSGAKQRNPIRNSLSMLYTRRVPHITGAYLAAGWAIVEAADWLADQGAFERAWVYAAIAGFLVLIPSVALSTYTHGAHGREPITTAEKICIPLNASIATLIATYIIASA